MLFLALFAVFLTACRTDEHSEQLEQLSSIWKVHREAIFGVPADEILEIASSPSQGSLRLEAATIGFTVVNFFQLSTNCGGGHADFNFGYLSNVCLVSKPSPSKPTKSYLFSCDGGKQPFLCRLP